MTLRRRSPPLWLLAALVAGGCGIDLAIDEIAAPILVRSTLGEALGGDAVVGLRSARLVGLRRLEVTGLEVVLPDSAGRVVVDRASLGFALSEVLGSTTRLRLVRVGGVQVEARRRDGRWPRLGAGGDARPPSDGRRLVIERLELEDGGFVALQAAGERLLTVDRVGATLSSLVAGDDPTVAVETTSLRAESPGWTDGWLEVVARGALSGDAWEIGSLEVTDGAGGRLNLSGSIGPTGSDGSALDLRLEGRLMRLGSLHPAIAQWVAADVAASVDLRAAGTTARPELSGRIATDSAGALSVEGSLDRVAGALLDVTATLDNTDFRRLLGGRGPDGRWSGTVSSRLALGEPALLDGDVTLELRLDGAAGPVDVAGGAEVADGVFHIDVRGDGRGQSTFARGDLRPFVSEPDYRITFESTVQAARGADPGHPLAMLGGPWDVTLTVEGRGLSAADAQAALEGRVRTTAALPSAVSGRLEGRVEEGSAELDVLVDVGDGSIRAHALVPIRDVGAWRVDRLEARDLPVGAWGAGGWAERVSGRGDASGRSGGLSGTFRLDSLSGGRLHGATASVELMTSAGFTTVSGTLSALGASASLERLDLVEGSPRRLELAFAGVDPSTLWDRAPAASIGGRISLGLGVPTAGRGAPRAPVAPTRADVGPLTGSLTLLGGLGDAPLAGSGDLTVEGRTVGFDLDAESAGEALHLAGELSASDPLSLTLSRARLDGIDPRRWLGASAPEGRVSGELTASWSGASPDRGRGRAAVRFDSTRVGGLALDGGTLVAQLEEGSGRATGWIRSRDREAGLDSDIEATARGWRASTSLSVRGVPAETRSDSLDATIDIAPFGDGPGSGYHVTIAGGGRVEEASVDTVSIEGRVADGAAHLARLRVSGPDVLIDGAGVLPLTRASEATASLEVTAGFERLGTLMPALGVFGPDAGARAVLRTTGPRADLRHDLDVEVTDAAGGAVVFDSMRIAARVRSTLQSWLSAAEAEVRTVGASAVALRPASAGPTLALGRPGGSRGSVQAALSWTADDPSSVQVRSADVSLDGEEWLLGAPTRVSWSDGLRFSGLELRTDGAWLRLDGRIGRAGAQSLVLDVRGLPIRVEADGETLLTRDVDLDVRLSGDAERLVGTLRGGVGRAAGGEPGATLDADFDSAGVRLALRGTQPGGGSFRADGAVPRRPSLSPGGPLFAATGGDVDLEIVVDSLDLSAAGPVLGLGSPDETRGRLEASVRVVGPERDARATGDLALHDLSARVASTGTRLRADRLVVTLDEREATFREVLIRDQRSGSVRLSGSVGLTNVADPTLSLRAELDAFELVDNETLEATVSGPVEFGGTVRGPRIGGALSVVSGTYHVPAADAVAGVEAVELTEEDYAEVERRFGVVRDRVADDRPHPLAPVALDVEITATTNVWARRTYDPTIAVELGGDLRLTKEPGGDLELRGGLEVVRGRSSVVQFGRRFQVSRGTIAFDGPPDEFELEARALFPVEDFEIWIDVERGEEGLEFVLGSEPPLSQSDIVAYLATGRRATDVERFGDESSAAADVGTELALAPVTAGVEDLARRQLGLDVVEIQQDGLNGLTLVGGRFVTPRFFVGVQQPVAFDVGEDTGHGIDHTQVNAEYRLSPWLMSHMTGGLSLIRVFLAFEHAR